MFGVNFDSPEALPGKPSSDGVLEEVPVDDKLSEEEALLYQSYATEVEGKEFNEQASPEAYEEAERLLRQFQDPKFDWLGIDWNKIDFKNLKDIEDVEERVRLAAQFLLNVTKEKDPQLFEKLVNMLGGEEKTADKIIATAGVSSLAFMVLSYFAMPLVGPDLAGVGSALGLLGPLALESPDLKIEIRSFIRTRMKENERRIAPQPIQVFNRSNSENKENLSEIEKRQIIEDSKSFSELYQNIKKIGEVVGSKRVYEPERLMDVIDRVRSGDMTIGSVTRTYGMRETVERLLKILPDEDPLKIRSIGLVPPKKDGERIEYIKRQQGI